MMTHRKLWFAAFMLVVLLAGAAGGALASRYLLIRGGPLGEPPAPPSAAQIVDRMSRNLGLTADQRPRLEAVFERNATRLEAFRTETSARFEGLRQQIDAEIDAILTPEQRVKFEAQRRQLPRRPPGAFPPLPPLQRQ